MVRTGGQLEPFYVQWPPLPLVCRERRHRLFLQLQYVELPIACFEMSVCWLASRYNDRAITLFTKPSLVQIYIDPCPPTWRPLEDNLRSFTNFLVRAMGLSRHGRGPSPVHAAFGVKSVKLLQGRIQLSSIYESTNGGILIINSVNIVLFMIAFVNGLW